MKGSMRVLIFVIVFFLVGAVVVPNGTADAATSSGNPVATYTISLNKTNLSLFKTKKATLVATVKVNGKVISSSSVKWKSSNLAVATISSTGVVLGKNKGTATITATANGVTAKCVVGVTGPKISKGSATIFKGKTLKLSVSGYKGTIKWKSSKKTVATVTSSGLVRAKKTGNVTITATVNGTTLKCKIKVKNPSVSISKTNITVKTGGSLKLTAYAVPTGSISYKSSNTSVATVSSAGLIKGSKAGTATVTVKANGVSKTCKVTVVSAVAANAKANAVKYSQFISDVVKYTNEYREANGLGKVTLNSSLTYMGCYRSEEMAEKEDATKQTALSHTRPDGTRPSDLAEALGINYTVLGENIGCYQATAKQIVREWYASPSHKANMLDGRYTQIGVGVAMTSDGYYYWTQIFSN